MEYLIMGAQFILSLSILIVLHEFGHFLPARFFNIRVEKFYLFFNPGFSLFKKQIGETEWGIGWLPLGGYVKIAGMMDESFDKEQMEAEPQPWEFRSKPAWQRLIIMVGGVTVNFILGFFLWGMVLFIWGEQYMPNENLIHGVMVDEYAEDIGLQNGDKITQIGEYKLERFESLRRDLIINQASTITVDRNGETKTFEIGPEQLKTLAGRNVGFAAPRTPFVVGKVVKDGPGKEAGIEKGDSIVSFNGQPTPFFDQYTELAETALGETIQLGIYRDGMYQDLAVTLDSCGKMKVSPYGSTYFFENSAETYAFGAAMSLGLSKGWSFLADNVKGFGLLFSGGIKAKDGLGGFGTIANLFPKKWEWRRFWHITAILSLILAFMNLLPIPLLDGGHVMFLFYEMISGKAPSEKFMEYAQTVGLVLLLALLLFANGNDLVRWWFSSSSAAAC